MSIKLNKTEATKNIINALDAMKADENINLGIEEIEFPDGSKEKFYYNGEADKQAAVHFAQICIDVCAGDSDKAKSMMASCFMLLTKGYNVDEIVASSERHEAGDTTIMFLRKKSEPDKPFYTIEVGIEVLTDTVSELRISQIHGFGNRWLGNDPDAIPTVVRWLRQNAIECDEAILTSTSTQYAMGRNFIKMPEVA